MTLCRCDSCWSSSWRSRASSSGSHSSSASTTSSDGGAEGAVDRRCRRAGRAACWPGRPGRPGSSSLAPGIISPSPASAPSCGVLGRAVGGRAVERGLRAGGRAFALGLVLALGSPRRSAARRSSDEFVELAEIEVEILDQPAGRPRIGVLVEDRAVELAEIPGDPRFEPAAATDRRRARRGRRRLAGQRLAGQQAHRLGHRAVGALGDALEALAAIVLVEHRRRDWRRRRPCGARPAPRPAPARPPRRSRAPAGCRAARLACTASSW